MYLYACGRHQCIQFAGVQQGQMQGLEAASSPGCRNVHWTVSPKGSCGLDSALTYKGNVNVRQMLCWGGCSNGSRTTGSAEVNPSGLGLPACCQGREPGCENIPCRCSCTEELGH